MTPQPTTAALVRAPVLGLNKGVPYVTPPRMLDITHRDHHAASCNDFSELHFDPGVADKAGFPDTPIHGLCVTSNAIQMIQDHGRAFIQGMVAMYRRNSLGASMPVFFGDSIFVEFRLHRAKPFGAGMFIIVNAKVFRTSPRVKTPEIVQKGQVSFLLYALKC